jgi:hypothetical protein
MTEDKTKVFLLAPGQWKLYEGIKIENTSDVMKRIVVTHIELAKPSKGK